MSTTKSTRNGWFRGLSAALAALTMIVIAPAEARAGYYEQVMSDNPIAWWRLGESSGSTASNEIVTAADGTYNGGFTLGQTNDLPGLLGNAAVLFNGSTGYMTANGAEFNSFGSGDFTIEAWMKNDGSSGSSDRMVTKDTSHPTYNNVESPALGIRGERQVARPCFVK